MNRRLVAAVVAIAAAGAVALFAAGRTWGSVTTRGFFGARQHVTVTGREVSSTLAALAIGVIALAVAALAGSGIVRRMAGGLAALLGTSLAAASLRARSDVGTVLARHVKFGHHAVGGSRPAWWVLSLVAAVVVVIAGVLVAVRGGAWSGMGRRFEPPAAKTSSADTDADAWAALDRGDDPTVVG